MKNLLFVALFGLALIFSSCGADQATVDAMADDMCKIMEKYNPEDPMTMLDISSEMLDLQSKDGYGSVTETQMMDAMKEKCPEGAEKMQSILDMGK
jgi:PBP1b-binding outer membrane lipoprotein LpoB